MARKSETKRHIIYTKGLERERVRERKRKRKREREKERISPCVCSVSKRLVRSYIHKFVCVCILCECLCVCRLPQLFVEAVPLSLFLSLTYFLVAACITTSMNEPRSWSIGNPC